MPFRRTPEGPVFDPTAGVFGSLARAFTTPGDVASGKIPITGPTGGYNPDLTQRGIETALSINLSNPAALAGERGWGPSSARPASPPAASVLKEVAGNLFDDVRLRAPDVLSSTIADRARQISLDLGQRFDRENAKGVFATLDAMLDPARSWTSMTELLARRDALKTAAAKGGPEGAAAAQALAQVNDMLSTQLGPANTRPQYAGGPYAPMAPNEVAPALGKAEGNWGAAQRSNALSGELDKARTGMVERGEGRRGNLDLNIRRSAESMLEKEKAVRSLSPEELKAVGNIQEGGFWRNLASDIGTTLGQSGLSRMVSMLGGGTGFGLLGTLIHGVTPAAGVPALAGALATPAIGAAARRVANAAARRAVETADELMRARSPMYEDILAARQTTPIGPLTSEQVQSVLRPGLLDALEDPRNNLYVPPGAPPKIERKLPAGYI